MAKEKILIIGGTSKLSEALLRILRPDGNFDISVISNNALFRNIYPDIRQYIISPLNIKDLKSACQIEKPDFIVNTVGLNDLIACEQDKKLCRDLNSILVENLVSISNVLDSHLIIFSSDFIFDGERGYYSETSKPLPFNYFGKSKLAAENACLTKSNNFTIIRTTPIIGLSSFGKEDYVSKMITNYSEMKNSSFNFDYITNPVFVEDLSLATYRIITKKRDGIFNAAGSDMLSLKDAFKLVAEHYGIVISDDSFLNETTKNIRKFGLITLKAETDLNIKPLRFESILTTMKYHQNIKLKFHTQNFY
jgi:dTDP-4-dehydrorhamnose reductase